MRKTELETLFYVLIYINYAARHKFRVQLNSDNHEKGASNHI